MAGKCNQDSCIPDETGCNVEGCEFPEDCPNYENEGVEESKDIVSEIEKSIRIPWTGNTLGITDLNYLTASSNVKVIGIVGESDVGKTTFLAALYCLLRHGRSIGDYQFAGSLTLIGWENISWYLRWKENGVVLYPPHTSINSGRVPGLLHLALRDSDGIKKDLIFTDAPGEWFVNWTITKDDEKAKGAEWIYKNSDGFLLFADCDMLSGKERGKGRSRVKFLSNRLKSDLGNRPMGLVWSKSDKEISETMYGQILSYIKNSPIKNFKEFRVSIKEGKDGVFHKNICSTIEWLLSIIESPKKSFLSVEIQKPEDLFLSKR